jgi:hypothetical protein
MPKPSRAYRDRLQVDLDLVKVDIARMVVERDRAMDAQDTFRGLHSTAADPLTVQAAATLAKFLTADIAGLVSSRESLIKKIADLDRLP